VSTNLPEEQRQLIEEDEDRRLKEAFLKASHESAVAWMKENPSDEAAHDGQPGLLAGDHR
jgi:hypothetical protein